MKDFMKNKEKVEQLNIIDDMFFQKMAEDIGFCEETISTVMGQKVKVLQVIPQGSIKNLQGRSVIVDALCELEDGSTVDVEVQKANDDDHQRRVRYNASCVTANITEPGERFEHVPDVVVIYISEFDMFKGGKTVYHVNRIVRETGQTVYNGLTEIYINTKIDDGSDIARMMKIYTEADSYDYERFPNISARKAEFKKDDGGRKMSNLFHEIARELAEEMAEEMAQERAEAIAQERAEAIAQERAEIMAQERAKELAQERVKEMVKDFLRAEIPIEKVIEAAPTLTPEEVKELADEVAADRGAGN